MVLGALVAAPAGAAERDCGELRANGTRYVAFVVQGAVTCEVARYVVQFVLANGPGSQGAPGRPPPGWTCGWGYLTADGRRGGRTGPTCERGRAVRVDGRPIVPEVESDPWPFPLARPVASPEAQAFMPLIFLDDDEHWPLSNPDWFMHSANVLHCPSGTGYGGCRRVGQASMLDSALQFMAFDPEQFRTGAPGAIFVHQTEPGQPAVPGGPPISAAYRFFDYWWFYTFNRGPYGFSKPVAGNFDHLSDWEGATVAVNPARPDVLDFVALSAHEAAWNYLPGVLRCGEGLAGDERHTTTCLPGRRRVNVYPAEGTHANFPRRCGRSLLQLNPLGRGICVQTGLQEVPGGGRINLPEGRFNGKDDTPTRIPTTSLTTLDALGPWDWPGYGGTWDTTGDVKTPTFQERFKDPLDGKRACTRRWDGPNVAVPCEELRRPTAVRLQALAAQAQGAVDPCEDWFGPMVNVSVCQPEALRSALAGGTLGEPGTLRVTGGPGTLDAAPGIAQVVTDPVTPAQPVEVFGGGEAAVVRMRAQVGGAAIDARFDGVALSETVPLRVTVSRGGAVRAVTPAGRRLRPTAQRRASIRRPAPLRRVSARRRGDGAVVVRFPRVSGRVALELLRTRGGRPLTAVSVSGRRGSVTVYARQRARFVVARRLSATSIPSRARMVGVR